MTHPPPQKRRFADAALAGDEPVTVIADPRVLYGLHDEELTPVLEAAEEPKAKSQVTGMRIALCAVLLVAVGLFAYRGLSRASFPQASAAQAAGKRSKASEAQAQAAAESAQAEPEEPELVLEATPDEAARSFALGEYEQALAQYRYLTQQKPDAQVYQVMVKVLSTRRGEH
jgi:hypothetical protein